MDFVNKCPCNQFTISQGRLLVICRHLFYGLYGLKLKEEVEEILNIDFELIQIEAMEKSLLDTKWYRVGAGKAIKMRFVPSTQ